jgi:hypothetical protein
LASLVFRPADGPPIGGILLGQPIRPHQHREHVTVQLDDRGDDARLQPRPITLGASASRRGGAALQIQNRFRFARALKHPVARRLPKRGRRIQDASGWLSSPLRRRMSFTPLPLPQEKHRSPGGAEPTITASGGRPSPSRARLSLSSPL